jgi:hypothetical protein
MVFPPIDCQVPKLYRMTEELEFDCGHGDLRLCLWRGAVHHGHPKDAPAQDARTAIRFTSRDEVDSVKNKIAFVKVDSEATMTAWEKTFTRSLIRHVPRF